MIYFGLGVLIAILITLICITYKSLSKYKNTLKSATEYITKSQQTFLDNLTRLRDTTINQDIYKSLTTMDGTHTCYADEDEANRELTTCLNLLGHTALYHQDIGSGRTVDIFVDNYAIIEGKLDPTQSELDRLIGQLDDYTSRGYRTFVVLYGHVSQTIANRINGQVVPRYNGKITVIYLKEVNRVRINKELHEHEL